jgi:Zn-dependent metalloprotease
MPRVLRSPLCLLLLATAGDPNASAMTPPRDPAAVSRLAAAETASTVEISLHPATGAVRFVRLAGPGDLAREVSGTATGPSRAALAARAADFLATHGSAFGLARPSQELVPDTPVVDALGYTHLGYRQVSRGIPVFGARLRLHFDPSGALYAANGTLVPSPRLDPTPRIPLAAARATAHAAVSAGLPVHQGRQLVTAKSRLLVFRQGLAAGLPGGRDHLAWEIEVTNRRQVRTFVYVDAHHGKVIETLEGIRQTLSRRAHYLGPNASQLVWSEGDPLPYAGGNTALVNQGVNEMIDFSAHSYTFFANLSAGTFLSWDGRSGVMKTVLDPPSLECPNASWNGRETSYCSLLTTDDVVAHEWSHAYTQSTHDLIYQWQPGALNEAYSDIFGETVDLLNGTGDGDDNQAPRAAGSCTARAGSGTDPSVRWLIAERANGNVLRDMWHPPCQRDPGKVSDREYSCLAADNGGVHTNSGVPNHAYALLVDGGTFNGQTVRGLGLVKAAHIYWRAMTVYQTPASDFADHADALEQSCRDLAAAGNDLPSLTSQGPSGERLALADCAELAKAIAAVELRSQTRCNFRPLLAPNAPPRCATGNVLPLLSQGFEGGFGDWTRSNQGVYPEYDPRDFVLDASLPDARPGTAAFAVSSLTIGDCQVGSDDQSGVMFLDSPAFTLPAGPTALAFEHYVATEADYDGGNLLLARNGGPFTLVPSSAFRFNPYSSPLDDRNNTSPLAGQPAWHGSNGGEVGGSWGESQVDLSALAAPGDTARLRFAFGVDGCNGLDGWYVDDVTVYQCGSGPVEPCVADRDTACLLAGRYRLEVEWENPYNDRSGRGVVLPNSDFTTFFAFEDEANVELVVKMLDFGNVIKVYYGQLTDFPFRLTITDTATGAVKTYRNSEGNCGGIDDGGFAKVALLAKTAGRSVAGTCVPSDHRLCLLDRRFAVEVEWANPGNDTRGAAVPQPLSNLSGLFTFTDARNVELLVKTLDFGDRILFLYGALSNLPYTIRVTDTTSGAVNVYANPQGRYCGAIDNQAF